MTRTTLLLALSVALLPGIAFGEDTTVFKSKGAAGETVYSQVETDNAQAHRVGVSEGEAAAPEAGAPSDTPMKTQAELACDRAKANLDVLSSDKRVMFDRDGDGAPDEMTAEERARDSDLAKRQVTAFCAPPAEEE